MVNCVARDYLVKLMHLVVQDSDSFVELLLCSTSYAAHFVCA